MTEINLNTMESLTLREILCLYRMNALASLKTADKASVLYYTLKDDVNVVERVIEQINKGES